VGTSFASGSGSTGVLPAVGAGGGSGEPRTFPAPGRPLDPELQQLLAQDMQRIMSYMVMGKHGAA
jgi:hypothetical protein